MKIQSSDTRRFLQFARKFWESTFEDDSQPVVFTFTANCYSIAMAKDTLMLTYLCHRVEFETSEQVIAVPFVTVV